MVWPIDPSRYAAKSPGSTDLFGDIIGRIAYDDGLYSGINQASNCPLIPNGSFESNANLDPIPTGWNVSALLGGSGIVTTSDSSHGSKSFMAVHPGGALNGGVVLSLLSALPVSIGQSFVFFFDSYSTNANVRAKVDVIWYDKDGSQIGATQNVFDCIGSYPGSWKTFSFSLFPCTAPSSAKFMLPIITLGAVGTDPGSPTHIFIDNISLTFRRPYTEYAEFSTTGTWTVPGGVNRAHVLAIGGGGGCGPYGFRGGGAAVCENFIDVSPGENVPVQVGIGGIYSEDGSSSVVKNLTAGGGKQATAISEGAGGTATGGVNLTGMDGKYIPACCGLGWFGGYGAGASGSGTPRGNGGFVLISY